MKTTAELRALIEAAEAMTPDEIHRHPMAAMDKMRALARELHLRADVEVGLLAEADTAEDEPRTDRCGTDREDRETPAERQERPENHEGYSGEDQRRDVPGRDRHGLSVSPADRPSTALSPDCRDGKCGACTGEAWDEVVDGLTPCTHGCHKSGGKK